ncbi:helicase-related protein [Sphingobacterium multivorum]|uniref:helicase-related protein n=1 Tax=Sphingobacterium multivorum TaxID=28454 RepID=UPI0028A5F22C|nr:helicase-related protein [Sphingobacterium multivorum]
MNTRDEILYAVEKEIVGPLNNPNYLDEESGEEILLASVHGSPKSRYGAGMLYPQQSEYTEEFDTGEDREEKDEQDDLNTKEIEGQRAEATMGDTAIDEEPVGLANQYFPSAMGFTVRFNANCENDLVKLHVTSAFYEKGNSKKAKLKRNEDGSISVVENKDGVVSNSEYWIRRPIIWESIELSIKSMILDGNKSSQFVIKRTNKDKPWLSLKVFDRSTENDQKEGYRIYTFVLINNLIAQTVDSIDSNNILYQNKLVLSTENNHLIAPYKERNSISDTDEEAELNLLYRKKRVFSIGHGASVVWNTMICPESGYEVVNRISTSIIPVYDLPQVAPTSHVHLSMLEMSDLGNWDEAKKGLLVLQNEYQKWISQIELEAEGLDRFKGIALSNIKKCQNSLDRIKTGIQILLESDTNSDVVLCFRWMNRAMLWQQQRSKTRIRKWVRAEKGEHAHLKLEGIDGATKEHIFQDLKTFHNKSEFNGRWRPFQLAFVLMNIESMVNPESKERGIVDLIWFPTGGGKTEAYLGLTAFSIFNRRIKIKEDFNEDLYGGTAVLMRYTLRLLTTQQYERASSLICACDLIRKENLLDLGSESISIGLWVGGDTTPNKLDQARSQLKSLQKEMKADYNFVVMKCPCCGSQIGKVDEPIKNGEKIKGLYADDGNNGKVGFKCENKYCEYFNEPLPLQVVDDLIYEKPPTVLLGTVDKFAMIPWRKEAGSLFGFRNGEKGWNRIIPPELIIQDELHLIAGPLGTMVGLYEVMIQTLCNNYKMEIPPFITVNNIDFVSPKIVASSATISRSYEQVRSLYGISSRAQLNIFPAQGLSFGDTWFSEEKSLFEKDDNGLQKYPGRRYVGILANGFPSMQTAIVRMYAVVLQSVKEVSVRGDIKEGEIDYYWTLLGYFNSIRELGGASSLVYGDIRERLGQLQSRDLKRHQERRYINRIEELTSRISSSDIPSTLKKLETSFVRDKIQALDICLATNMVATGVDISRLGLMFIHGQPKTTAEYIQASSRVGRDLQTGPGIIFTLYSPTKPRDKSHYEQFQGYHSRIYSNVEPTSVTPFSVNARERGLHAILIGMVRYFSSGEIKDSPIINKEFEDLIVIVSNIIKKKCEIVDRNELNNTESLIDSRIKFWRKGFQSYGDAANFEILNKDEFYPLMYASSAEVKEDIILNNRSLATPTSMRGVDTESVLSIYSNGNQDGK